MNKITGEIPFDEIRVVQATNGELSVELWYQGKAGWRHPIPELDEHQHLTIGPVKGSIGFTVGPA